VDIISRAEWGARAPRARETTTWARRTEFVVHYSEGPTTQTPRQIQNYHMDSNGWSDIGYNFLVDVRGRIYEGRGWLVVGAHAPNHNTSGIGVCFIGRDGDATDAAKNAIRWLYDEACRRKGGTLAKRGHRDVTATSCPGDQLYAWVRAGMPAPGSEDDDMPISDADAKKIAEQVWKVDGVIAAPPWKAAEGNKYWLAASYLHWGYRQGATTQDQVKAVMAKVDALAADLAEIKQLLTAKE